MFVRVRAESREAEALPDDKPQANATDQGIANMLAFCFTIVILIYAASSALSELVRWIVETTTADFDQMSRRDQPLALRSHWLGARFRSFERGVLLPTGMILGLPILFSFSIALVTLHKAPRLRFFNWGLVALSTVILLAWIGNLFAIDGGILPVAQPLDFVLFPIATAMALYLTWRFYGGCIDRRLVSRWPVRSC